MLDDVVDRVALLVVVRNEDRNEMLAQVGDHRTEDGDERDSTLEQRGRRMQPVPFAVGESVCLHKPARRLSATDTR